MTDREMAAYTLWSFRAGLNVAALQCQFSKALRTVDNYNAFLRQHSDELAAAYKVMGDYFQRTGGRGKAGLGKFDSFNTRMFQSYATFDAQYAFCNAAAEAGRRALAVPKGRATEFAGPEGAKLRASVVGPSRDLAALAPSFEWVRVPDVAGAARRGRR